MEFRIKVDLDIRFEIEENKTYEMVYLERSKSYFSDTVYFKGNSMVIEGKRSGRINIEEALYTVNSNYRTSIIKGLIYIYYKYGEFNLNRIIFSNGEKSHSINSNQLNQEFKVVPPIKIMDDVDPKYFFKKTRKVNQL